MAVEYVRDGAIACVLIDNPPVNVFSAEVRRGLMNGLQKAGCDPSVQAIVIACRGRSFVTGADMAEFEHGFGEPGYRECMAALEECQKPTIVALHGTAMGAGVELAIAAHYRTAQPAARMALPEITLGVVPGAGGTQRLPRLVGQEKAFDILLSGAPVGAADALSMGLVDDVREGDPAQCGVAFARQLIGEGKGPRPTREGDRAAVALAPEAISAGFDRHARGLKGRTTQHLIVEALAASSGDFDAGIEAEHKLSQTSLASRESLALRHMFFAERRSAVIPSLPDDVQPAQIKSVTVVGAGTMGSGIAMACANAGLAVSLVDNAEAGLERGRQIIRSAYEADEKRGRLRAASVDDAVAGVTFTLDKDVMATSDLVIEAVFEDMDLKKSVLADIGSRVGPDCVIASNTSSLSVTQLGEASGRPQKVLGLHFFSPAHIMKLLEIVRGDKTVADTLVTGLAFAKKIRKTPVVSGDGFAFIGNRMMLDGAYREGELMLLEGCSVDLLDRAVEGFGFAMGPNRVNDMAGVDIGTLVRQQLALREKRPDPYSIVSDELTAMGRTGQKSGKGFYDFAQNPRKGAIDPIVTALIEKLAAQRGIERRAFSEEEISERFVLQLINIGAQILDEGIAYRAADIDVVWVHGYGFPRYKGGPMFYADTLGLAHVVERIRHWQGQYDAYWEPAELLVRLAETSGSFAEYDRSNAPAGR